MANNSTDEPIPEELDSDAAEESSDDRQSQCDAPEEAKGQSKAEEGQADAADSGAQDDTDTGASVSFSYAVAPGVKAGAGLHFEENDGYDDDAVGAVMAIQMSF